MKRTMINFVLYLVVSFLLIACSFAITGGPQTWIDKPLDNSTLPLAPIFIMAHASDGDGIASIEYYVNGQFIISAIPADGAGVRLGDAEAKFTPAEPGEYRIEVHAVDSAGNAGSPAVAKVIVAGEIVIPAPDELPTDPPPTDLPPTEPPATQAPSTQLPSSGDVSVSFYASPATVSAGNCSTLHWDVEGTDKVLWNGKSVYFRGAEERCICENETHKLQVTKPDNTTQDYWVTISVTGSCSAPPTDPPPADVLPPDPIDTTPPFIWGAATNKNTMCSNEKVTANIITGDEESPVTRVFANWTITGPSGNTVGSGNKNFTPISGQPYGYTAQFGPPNSGAGMLTINGTVENSSNPPLFSYFTLTVTINVC